MTKALAAMRGPLSYTAVELSKCQHQTVVDLVDLAGMESLVVPALKAVPVAQVHVQRALEGQTARHGLVETMTVRGSVEMMTGQLDRAETTVVQLDRVGMMTVRGFVEMMTSHRVHAGMMIVRGSAGMMSDLQGRVEMTVPHDRHVRVLRHNRRPTRFVTAEVAAA